MAAPHNLIWTPQAWLDGWQRNVLLEIDGQGCWANISAGVVLPPAGAQVLAGALLPGLVNAHSHAFQRAFAGLAECRESAEDDFWGWRERMYQVALRITPAQLQAVAAQLYVELLAGGYTQVCEFHYLQHQPDGVAYADPLTLSWALADAASVAGIGATLMPVVYERAGFAQPQLKAEQRRFAAGAEHVWQAASRIDAAGKPLVNAGVALHSLRAARPESIAQLRKLCEGWNGPIHIHVAEQTGEVADCLAATGMRPMQWLASQGHLDARWQLVHATHSTQAEIEQVQTSGAGVVICPSTEANLGDGLADIPAWLAAGVQTPGVPMAIGGDSHVCRDWREELRWLEYGQRLQLRKRNVAARPGGSSAAELFNQATTAGGRAAGFASWGLRKGARADALVLDANQPSLLGIAAEKLLDALVFSSPSQPWRNVMVAGRWVIQNGEHANSKRIASQFSDAMQALWQAA